GQGVDAGGVLGEDALGGQAVPVAVGRIHHECHPAGRWSTARARARLVCIIFKRERRDNWPHTQLSASEFAMNETPIVSSNREEKWFQQMLALYGAPAYVRRAQNVEAAWQQLVECCQRQRHEWLALARTGLAILRDLAGEWTKLEPILAGSDAVAVLADLEQQLQPAERPRAEPSASVRRWRRALSELVESLSYFNQRWEIFLAK